MVLCKASNSPSLTAEEGGAGLFPDKNQAAMAENISGQNKVSCRAHDCAKAACGGGHRV